MKMILWVLAGNHAEFIQFCMDNPPKRGVNLRKVNSLEDLLAVEKPIVALVGTYHTHPVYTVGLFSTVFDAGGVLIDFDTSTEFRYDSLHYKPDLEEEMCLEAS